MHRLILIERDAPSYKSWPSLIKKKRISELSVEEVIRKYQGFEGDLICFLKLMKIQLNTKKRLNKFLNIIN